MPSLTSSRWGKGGENTLPFVRVLFLRFGFRVMLSHRSFCTCARSTCKGSLLFAGYWTWIGLNASGVLTIRLSGVFHLPGTDAL